MAFNLSFTTTEALAVQSAIDHRLRLTTWGEHNVLERIKLLRTRKRIEKELSGQVERVQATGRHTAFMQRHQEPDVMPEIVEALDKLDQEQHYPNPHTGGPILSARRRTK